MSKTQLELTETIAYIQERTGCTEDEAYQILYEGCQSGKLKPTAVNRLTGERVAVPAHVWDEPLAQLRQTIFKSKKPH